MNILMLLAQATTTTQPAADAAPGWFQILRSPFPLLILAFVVMMMFSNRTKKKAESSRQEMLKQLKRGDRIRTIGGIFGTVLKADETKVEVKVDESNNTKIWFARTAIDRVVEDDKAEAK